MSENPAIEPRRDEPASPVGLSAQAQALLNRFDEVGVRPYCELSVLAARETMNQSTHLQARPQPVSRTQDVLAFDRIPVRIYHPDSDTTLPIIVYLHGGGWVGGNVALADEPCRALANATGLVVASVEYRLSPESKFPEPLQDCYAAVQWLVSNAAVLGIDRSCVIICGDSAGGNLAAGVGRLARDRGDLTVHGQILLYPLLAPAESDEFRSRSDFAKGYGLTREDITWFWSHYLRSALDSDNPLASPWAATDLSGLPPGLIITAEFDPLRDEGAEYSRRLQRAGVATTYMDIAGTIHGFFWMSRRLGDSPTVHRAIADFIQRIVA
ncbi:MAG TPA: alpha/beta hydrolase [Gemmatimonadaceae bacterium]|jgi:acetyl esterase